MAKNKRSLLWKLLGVAMIVSWTGCSAAYHDYSDCRIPYLYCPPPPLPYVTYDGCHCPTPGAAAYFQEQDVSVDSVLDSDVPTEVPIPGEDGEPVVLTFQ